MAGGNVHILTEQGAVERIADTLKGAGVGAAPFALVLGAGFSHGLVPTARELVVESLPLWMKSLENGDPFEALQKRLSHDECAAIAGDYWNKFVASNRASGLTLTLDNKGLPEDIAAAYQAAFHPWYAGAVGSPSEARTFQRVLMRLDQPRLNASHFLLASILGAQPGKTRPSELFTKRAALTRLILTTNFDPFLQMALQSVNRLYFMSDTPDLGLGDEIYDDATDAVHLVYVHGSIHRRSQAATDETIAEIKQRNARILAPVLKRHGVIVLGYSGWDDTIVDALAACESFDHRLYWCGRYVDPLAKGAFGARVADVLARPSASYVRIDSAGQFMARLSEALVRGLPRLLDNPIAQIRQMLETIDLSELGALKPASTPEASGGGLAVASPAAPASSPASNKSPQEVQSSSAGSVVEVRQSMFEVKSFTIERLKQAEALFLGKLVVAAVPDAGHALPAGAARTPSEDAARTRPIDQLLSSISVASALSNYAEQIRLSTEGLDLPDLPSSQRVRLLQIRALARFNLRDMPGALEDWDALLSVPGVTGEEVATALYNRGVSRSQVHDLENAIEDFTTVVTTPGASAETVARAFSNRGVLWSRMNDFAREIADYSQVIDEMPEAPVDQVALALNNRGAAWGRRDDADRAIADSTRAIELEGAPVAQVAIALNNRSLAWRRKNEIEKEIADQTRVIDGLAGAPADQVAIALNNRAFAWSRQNETEKELADYARVIDGLAGAPADQVALALNNRAITRLDRGEMDQALADYTRVSDGLAGAPAKQVAIALIGRGAEWFRRNEIEKSIADITRVVEALPDVPVEQMAMALNNRALAWRRQRAFDKELADYTRVIETLAGAPVKQLAIALNGRTGVWRQRRDLEKQIADASRVIEQLPDAPASAIAEALVNRAMVRAETNETAQAIADYTRVIDALPGVPAGQVAKALNGRGTAWDKQGEPGKAVADYTRIIEGLPDAPSPQVAAAYTNRGWHFYQLGAFDRFLADTEASLAIGSRGGVSDFNLGLARLANGLDREALEAYSQAAERYPGRIHDLGLADVERAVGRWLSAERAQPVIDLLRSRADAWAASKPPRSGSAAPA